MAIDPEKEEALNQEIKQKITTIDSEAYDPGPPLTNVDYSLIIIIGCVCIVGLFWGGI